jgi:CRP-like cAMP-binding protein
MADDPKTHDLRWHEPLAQGAGAEAQWTDVPDRMALVLYDRWAGPYLPRAEAPFLAEGYAEDWQRLEQHAVRQRFRAGDEIIRRGHFERSLIIVVSGLLSLIVFDQAGGEHVLDIIGARSLVGEIGFFDPGALAMAVRARGDGELLRLSLSRFEALAASCPLLGRTILLEAGRIAVGRLRRVLALATDGVPGTV